MSLEQIVAEALSDVLVPNPMLTDAACPGPKLAVFERALQEGLVH
jgi:hypothetical protein